MIFINKLEKSSRHLMMLTALLFLFSCAGKKEGTTTSEALKAPELPVPPEVITDPQGRASYIVDHVWGSIETLDSVSFASPEQMEQFFVDYFAIGNIAEAGTFEASVKELFDKGTPAIDSIVLSFNERYISYPNSPLYNLGQYFQVLSVADKLGLLNEVEKLRYEEGYKLFLKNREGVLAEDFPYETPNGERHTLYGDTYGGNRLLVFYNPDCHTCEQVLGYLGRSERVQKAVREGRLDVLCIYPDGDEERWRERLNEIPNFASVGMDVEGVILRESLYDLQASPTLYLLDNERKVLMKDLFPDQLEDFLSTDD